MKKYKYCHINDENEEIIGIVEAKSLMNHPLFGLIFQIQ